MRILVISALIACAASLPAPIIPYPVAVNPAIAPPRPTISAGDINGAAIDAQVQLSDNLRAAIDVERQLVDKANELRDLEAEQQGQALNQAEENAWRAVDNANTVEAVLDGIAARDAPVIAKNIVRNTGLAGIAPIVADKALNDPVAYATSPISYVSYPNGYVRPLALPTPAYSRFYNYPVEFAQNVAYAF